MDLLSLIQGGSLANNPLLASIAGGGDVDTTPPVDAAGSAQAINAQPISASPPLPPPTTAQLAAQQAPLHSPGGTLWQRVLGALAPVPSAYQGMLSPDAQRQAQLRAIQNIGIGLMGGLTKPGESNAFGPSLARGLMASQQGMDQALGPESQALQLQGTQETEAMRHAYAQGIQNAPPELKITPNDDLQTIQRKASSLAGYYATVPGADKEVTAMANLARSVRMQAYQMGIAPADWWDQYKQDHPAPAAGSKDEAQWHRDAASAAGQQGYIKTESQERSIADQVDRNTHFNRTAGQRDTSLGLTADRLGTTEGQALVNRKDVAPLLASVPAINMTQAVIDEAKKGNPAAYESVIGNFAQTVDQKAQLRTQMFEIMSRLDPSVAGRFAIAWNRLETGTWRKEDLANVESILKSVKASRQAEYKKAYDPYIKANPKAMGKVPSPETLFGAPPATAGENPAVKALGINP